jgi:hypothetical protein
MFANPSANWYHSNQYSAQAACEHCGGIVRHEKWCITRDAAVQYAYSVVLEPENLTLCDRLHSPRSRCFVGKNPCAGACRQSDES